MRVTGASIAKTSVNLCLLLASCAAGLFLCELSLRLFYPKYRDLAEAPFRRDESRIWARMPNARNLWLHPDTRSLHALFHNNFGLRQHRNFSAADLASAINVGVFGDSFVENVRMDAPYSFTEPLDWLLNQGARRFNVLNFGVEGYDPGQSFLHHEHFRYADDLDYVFFVYCSNDLREILQTELFHLDSEGRLVRNEAKSSWWVRFISELHVSYLVLDVIENDRFSETFPFNENPKTFRRRSPGQAHDVEESLAIFQRLVRRWKRVVEENGGRFVVVMLPDSPADPRITTLLEEEDVEAIDLYDCFRDYDDDHRQWRRSPYRFRRDNHWNENGNRLAAVCLHRFLEREARLPASEDAPGEALHQYYSAFGGWMPPGSPGGVSSDGAGIREKYQALGDPHSFRLRAEVRKLMRTPKKRIIRSDFDVYLDGRELVYVKDDCSETDVRGSLFLKVTSVDGRSFMEEVGCCRLSMSEVTMIDEKLCAAKKVLPDYPAHVVTGKYGALGWQADAVIDRDAFRKALEKAVAPEKLVIRSDFDVYLDGKWLTYVKDVCSPPAQRRRFFLHVTPGDARDLPEGSEEFDNQDFSQPGVHVDALGCVVRRRLPDYAVRRVRTGQFVRVEEGRWKNFWEGEFSISRADADERRSRN